MGGQQNVCRYFVVQRNRRLEPNLYVKCETDECGKTGKRAAQGV
jgi:hypothetical protein